MKENFLKSIQLFSFTVLFGISVILTTALFLQFSDNLAYKIVWGALAVTLECVKIIIFILLKDQVEHTNLVHYRSISIIPSVVMKGVLYLGLAFISIVASAGFTLQTIESQSFYAASHNVSFDLTQDRIKALSAETLILQDSIQSKLAAQSELGGLYPTLSERYDAQIAELRVALQLIFDEQKQLAEASTTELNSTVSSAQDVFSLLGSKVNREGADVMFLLMILLSLILEIALDYTVGHIDREEDIVTDATASSSFSSTETLEKAKKKRGRGKNKSRGFQYYLDVLNPDSGVRLLSDKRISEQYGIPLEDCERYRAYLKTLYHEDKPLISTKRGGSKANFSKEVIIKVIKQHLKETKAAVVGKDGLVS